MIFRFDGDLSSDVLATKRFVRGQPGCRISVALGLICRTIDCHEVERIVGKLFTLLSGNLLCALLPGVTQRHDMVDLHSLRSFFTALKLDGLTGVRIVERARIDPTFFRIHHDIRQITRQYRLARTTPVNLTPTIAKLFALIASFWRTTLNFELFELLARRCRAAK